MDCFTLVLRGYRISLSIVGQTDGSSGWKLHLQAGDDPGTTLAVGGNFPTLIEAQKAGMAALLEYKILKMGHRHSNRWVLH